ncbi:MAG: response regulator [Gemmatimonadetes bacterium]|nr:response regulator [Gemmatimonadota bacterium]
MPSPLRIIPIFWAYTLAYGVWAVAMGTGIVSRGAFNDVISMPSYFVPGMVLCRAAWVTHAEPRVRIALGLIGAAWIAPGLSFLVALIPDWEATPWIYHVCWGLYWSYYPVVVIGLGLLAIVPRERGVRVRLLLDSGLVVVAAAVLQWYFAVRLRPAPLPEVWRDLGILFPTELLIAFGAAVLVYRPVEPGASPWPRALGAGMFLSAISDFVYEYRKLTFLPWPAPMGDILFTVASAFVVTAGARALEPARPAPRAMDARAGLTSLPYIAIACVGALLTWESARNGLTDPVAGLVIGGSLLVALVILRLALEQRAATTAQARQAALDARFRALVQRSTDAILVVAPHGTIDYASPAFGRLLGRTEEPTGQPLRSLVPDASADPASLARGGPPGRWTVDAPGGPRTLDVVTTDLRHDAAVGGYVVNLRDVTDQVALEQRLRDAQKLEVVGRLASSVAHDFNNLLTVVIGNASLALAHPVERTRPQWEAVRGAAERGAALARQLLSLGRPAPRSGAVTDLHAELQRIVEMLRTILPSSLQVKLAMPSAPVPAPIAASELEQVILNLALNARDAVSGAGTLGITLEADRGRCTLRVIDTGVGMDEPTRTRALDPFFTTKAPHEGTGLGLSTALQVVQSCGGDLAITSHPGQGTTVTITLPYLDGVRVPTSVPAMPEGAPRGQGRILVVDDERAVREVLARYLAATGFTILEATDGANALEVLDRAGWQVDAVLTDLVMPNLSGQELIRRVAERDASLPILCMSGNGLPASDTETARRLAAPVIQKPPALDRVARLLVAALVAQTRQQEETLA